jgi:hypothetical protein
MNMKSPFVILIKYEEDDDKKTMSKHHSCLPLTSWDVSSREKLKIIDEE